MAAAAAAASCPPEADIQFGPRVDPSCRPFDFTLLFEDGFFIALPAAVFLLLLPWRLRLLFKAPVKVVSYRLATWKLASLTVCETPALGLTRLRLRVFWHFSLPFA